MAPRLRDIAGQRYSKLLALEFAGYKTLSHCRKSLWRCRCDCGNEVIVAYVHLVAADTKSCGCIVGKHKTTHGATGTAEFRCWEAMLRRCRDPNHDCYSSYGGRGIQVCERWLKFENFIADMGKRPSPKHSLDRKNNDGHYEPSNCRWATDIVQSNNRRSSRRIEFNGESLTMAEWERRVGLKPGMLFRRLQANWPIAEALNPTLRQGQRVYRRGVERVKALEHAY